MNEKPLNRPLIVVCVMLVAIIEVLDMTIVNVTLPDMMGQLGANSDQITWVLTSYIVSSAIFMPLTGLLVKQVGLKRLLLANIIGFLISSMLCGMSTSFAQILIFRILQGVFGASLVPLSQFVLRDTFTQQEQGMAMAIWGIGIMTAPVLGPTLGGYIAEHLTWRWVFFINVPVCLFAWLLALKVIRDTERENTKIDWLGLIIMGLGVGSLQTWLDRGNSSGWLDSNFIILLIIISAIFLTIFIVRGATNDKNIVDLKVFANQHFAASTALLTFYCLAMMGTIALQPLMLETLFHYPSDTTGLLMAPRGLCSAISMIIAAQMMKKIDVRYIIAIGICLSALGNYMMTWFNLSVSFNYMIWPGVVQGFGMGLFFVPVSAISMVSLEGKALAEASGLFSFGRSLGSSIGISLVTTILARERKLIGIS